MIHKSIIKTNKMMSKLLLYVLYISQIMCCVQGNMNHHLPYSLGIRDSIMIAHSFHDHPAFGPAGKMHGATYTCDVEFKTNKLVPTVNWVIDIGVASELLAEVLSKYNMKNLDEVFSNGEFTTTEFMARRIFEDLRGKLRQCIQDKCSEEDQGQFEGRIKVKLFESHKAWASYEATKKNDLEGVLKALENGGNPNYAPSKDVRPILFDSVRQDTEEGSMCTKALLSNGADTDVGLISNYNSVLHEAASIGSKSQCEVLLQHEKVDKEPPLINRENSYGNTPLFSAIRNGSVETVKLLLDNNADVNHLNHLGSHCLHLCCFLATPSEQSTKYLSPPISNQGSDEASSEKDFVKIASMIISTGKVADLDLYDKTGHTPLHIASVRGCIPLIKLLLESGADMNKLTQHDYKGRGKRNALSMASFGGMKKSHELLLKYQQNHSNDTSNI